MVEVIVELPIPKEKHTLIGEEYGSFLAEQYTQEKYLVDQDLVIVYPSHVRFVSASVTVGFLEEICKLFSLRELPRVVFHVEGNPILTRKINDDRQFAKHLSKRKEV